MEFYHHAEANEKHNKIYHFLTKDVFKNDIFTKQESFK